MPRIKKPPPGRPLGRNSNSNSYQYRHRLPIDRLPPNRAQVSVLINRYHKTSPWNSPNDRTSTTTTTTTMTTRRTTTSRCLYARVYLFVVKGCPRPESRFENRNRAGRSPARSADRSTSAAPPSRSSARSGPSPTSSVMFAENSNRPKRLSISPLTNWSGGAGGGP